VTARSADAAAWAESGSFRDLCGQRIFTRVVPALGDEIAAPLLVIHGFPSSSADYRCVLDRLRAGRRVLLFDMLGYGLSAKPDRSYTVDAQADIAAAFVADVGVSEVDLLTHDLGDTVGGELLARNLRGSWPVSVVRRVLTNGSIYIELAHLSAGQELLLSLPDERLGDDFPLDAGTLASSLAATFSPRTDITGPGVASELALMGELIVHGGGDRILPRLIRYIEERRRNQPRFTGAIEAHPSPLHVVWGEDDPIAVVAMTEELRRARPGTPVVRLEGVGHYPMVEAPDRYADAVMAALA
jgi:pimeloyl-ACP methyl ester carboxylesterase